jgi:hypothetical protein
LATNGLIGMNLNISTERYIKIESHRSKSSS